MKILFTTAKKEAVSTILNLEKLKLLQEIEGVDFRAFGDDFENYDIILVMGYEAEVEKIKDKAPKSLVGVIDPRPGLKKQPEKADFILTNGIEMKDYYSYCTQNFFDYYIYPQVSGGPKKHKNQDKVVIGYHGNKIHLEEIFPRISQALESLGKLFKVELKAIYNWEKLGKVSWKPKSFSLTYVQWNSKVYEEHLSQVDIGIIPDLIPIQKEDRIKKKASTLRKKYNEHQADYLLRFKPTSNPGRIFPFMQYGIPVVCDMFPSGLQLIDDGQDSFIAYSSSAWFSKLKSLAEDSELRQEMGDNFRAKFQSGYSPEILNQNLIKFFYSLLNKK